MGTNGGISTAKAGIPSSTVGKLEEIY